MRYAKSVKCFNSRAEIEVEFNPPAVCPQCGASIDPVFLSAYIVNKFMYVFYLCLGCCQPFISEYVVSDDGPTHQCILARSYPDIPRPVEFPDEIQQLSPKFVKIYNQASFAESYGLDEVAGIGYRKALEFLVKDYAIHSFPDSSEEIRNQFLGKVIKNYISEPKIKILAERSAWLGNDETHYIRVFDGYDINTLRKFIDAIVTIIHTDFVFEESLGIQKP